MPRPISAVISTQAMMHNLVQVRARIQALHAYLLSQQSLTSLSYPIKGGVENTVTQLPSAVKILAIIKANAYGHGILNALKGFARADGLGMIDIADAVLCREHGWKKHLLLLEGFFHASDIEVLQQYQVTTAIHSLYQIELLKQATLVGKPINVLVKFNTGMNRLGFKPDQVEEVLGLLRGLQQQGKVGHIGCMSHFANADLSPDYVKTALEHIISLRHFFEGPLSICNSAATVRYPQLALQHTENWLRPGICLYGSTPFDTTPVALQGNLAEQANLLTNTVLETQSGYLAPVVFKPTMTLMADIIAVQVIQRGESIGYGSTFIAEKPMRVAVVACGYADGYPRSAPLGTPVMVDGQSAYVVGRVSMDMMTIDISHLPNAGVGSNVVLWGEGGPSIDEVANKAGRIAYEMMCNLAKRVPVRVI